MESTELEVDSFLHLGIPEDTIRCQVIPALAVLGVCNTEQLRAFSKDRELQEEAISSCDLPVVFIEVICARYGSVLDTNVLEKISVEQSVLPEISSQHIEPRKPSKWPSWLMCISCALIVFVGTFAFAGFKKELFSFVKFVGLENLNGAFGLQEEFNGEVLSQLTSHAGDFEHDFEKCDMNDIHDQKYFRLSGSEDGYLCMRGFWGRLNNKVQEMYNALWIAHELNRTLIVEREISRYFDIKRWQDIFPHVKYRVAVPGRGEFRHMCKGSNAIYIAGPNDHRNKMLHTRSGRQALKKELRKNKNKFVAIAATTVFYLMETDHAFLRAFFANLYPSANIRLKVDEYINRTFGTRPYMAVHLRSLEGSCTGRMSRANLSDEVCSPSKKMTTKMLQAIQANSENVSPDFSSTFLSNIYVASDHQKKDRMITYKPKGHFFDGECSSRECAMIDFEIAARSDFFIGTFASSATRTIARLREYRRIRPGIFYPGILYWNKDTSLKDFDHSFWGEHKS
mmetsp:Transcript_8371/g.10046  ORF Transcript_8371/g.10046 Transcript_8371/m.10046 type:complete len:511 (-) Transcript_8371:425-1957(-)